MIELTSRSAAETEELGAALARLLAPGDVVLLVGGLGSGKTTLVKGVARALGYKGEVTSPTFTLTHVYDSAPRLVHADLWRLDRVAEVEQLALDEEADSVVVVEWGEAAADVFGGAALTVTIETLDDETRRILLDTAAAPWSGRATELERVLS